MDERPDTRCRPTPARLPPAAASRVRLLSFHAAYACGNTGCCCAAGWAIPVETHVLPALQYAIAGGAIRGVDESPLLVVPPQRPAAVSAVLGRTGAGPCVFFDRLQPGGHCRVQRHAGVPAMPVACRQFPRIARHDTTGTVVSLSHWCPTALATLEADRAVTVVEDPPAFRGASHFEGLDARDTWPPFLRPDCLFDLPAFERLEAHGVAVLTASADPIERRLSRLTGMFEHVRRWRPHAGSLRTWVTHAADVAIRSPAPDGMAARATDDRLETGTRLWCGVLDAIPLDLRVHLPPGLEEADGDVPDVWNDPSTRNQLGRYLAARFFGSWVAYHGDGLRSLLASVHAAAVVVHRALQASPVETTPARRLAAAIRTADLLLVHLACPEELARHYSQWERQPPRFVMNAAYGGERV